MKDTDRIPNELILDVEDVVSLGQNVVRLCCSRPVPPGSRVAFALKGELVAIGTLHGKIIRLEKTQNGNLIVSVRLHGLTKEQRLVLSKQSE